MHLGQLHEHTGSELLAQDLSHGPHCGGVRFGIRGRLLRSDEQTVQAEERGAGQRDEDLSSRTAPGPPSGRIGQTAPFAGHQRGHLSVRKEQAGHAPVVDVDTTVLSGATRA